MMIMIMIRVTSVCTILIKTIATTMMVTMLVVKERM